MQAGEGKGGNRQQRQPLGARLRAAEAVEKQAAKQQFFQQRRRQHDINRHQQRQLGEQLGKHLLVLQAVGGGLLPQPAAEHFVKRIDRQHQHQPRRHDGGLAFAPNGVCLRQHTVRIQKTPVAAAAENGQPDNGGEKQQRFAPFERVARQHLPLCHAQRLVEADKQPDHKRQADKISRCQ